MKEMARTEVDAIIESGKITTYEANWLSREIYSSRGMGNILINNEKRLNRLMKRIGVQCEGCGSLLLGNKVFISVDESNEAITKNSPVKCGSCWGTK